MIDGTILSTAKHLLWYNPLTYLPHLIRKFTKGMVSHSAVVINIDGICFVAESKMPQVTLTPFEQWKNQKMDIYMTIPESVPEDFRYRVLSKVGVAKYDYRLLFLIQPFYLLTGIWVNVGQGRKGEPFTCSEFVGYALDIREPHKLIPSDLIKDNYELI